MTRIHRLTPVAAAVALACACGSAQAFETLEFGQGATLETRLTFTYTLADRIEDQSKLLAANAGQNDGDNNFDQWALTSNRLAALFETKLNQPIGLGSLGLVASASAFYDDAYHGKNDNDPGNGVAGAGYNPNFVNHERPFNEFTGMAEKYHGGYSRILDAYGYGLFDLSGHRLSARVGRQVVSWGEALYFPGISLMQGPADGSKTGIPGTEVKDQLLPEDQVSFSFELTPDWSLLGHWQFGFHETIAPAPGSYLNTSDAVGPGGKCLQYWTKVNPIPQVGFPGYEGCAFGTRGKDILPSDTGQWGVGTRYRVTDATEVGLYYLNATDRSPLPEINAFTPGPFAASPVVALRSLGGGSYRIRYFDDVKLIGATATTSLGLVSVAGEVSYKDGAPVLVNTLVNPQRPDLTSSYIPNPTRGKVWQTNVNAMANFGRTVLAPQTLLIGEVSWVNIASVDPRKAPGVETLPPAYQAYYPSTKDQTFDSENAWAFATTGSFGYPNLFEGWDLNVALAYSSQIAGRSLLGGVGGEGDQRFSVGATFTRQSNLSLGLSYNGYAGGASTAATTNGAPNLKVYRALTDRDYVSFVAKYAF